MTEVSKQHSKVDIDGLGARIRSGFLRSDSAYAERSEYDALIDLEEYAKNLEEQLQSLQVALSFYAEKGGDGGAVARSVLKNERPPEHVFAFFRELHGVSNPARER